MNYLTDKYLEELIDRSFQEDVGQGDVTSDLLLSDNLVSRFSIRAREDMILCGNIIVERIFEKFNLTNIGIHKNDGDFVQKGEVFIEGTEKTKNILTTERIILNFLQHLSSISTLTKKFVDEVSHTKAKILDTRKTLPTFRPLQKYAVKIGGGYNHRYNLSKAVLIKDNHIAAIGSITEAVSRIKEKIAVNYKIEVECDNLEQVAEAIDAQIDIIMLDNMSLHDMEKAVKMVDGVAKIEASGGVHLGNVRNIAETGVDYISVGALTHSVKAIDIGLDFDE